VRTTAPRPVDIEAVFPELASSARTATRLHPRPGTPSVHDSSVGGPLLWPADEPWPHCDGPHDSDELIPPQSLADARSGRSAPLPDTRGLAEFLAAAGRREFTPEEWETIDRREQGVPLPASPNAMLPVAQLYARDVPGLRFPAGKDLLQVLWCPLDNSEGMPETALFWRCAAEVGEVLIDPPEPAAVDYFDQYVPVPCTLDPEQILEYPTDLDGELGERVGRWTMRDIPWVTLGGVSDDDNPYYSLCVAPGWKIGGHIRWGLTDPFAQPCPACGVETEPLLTVATYEYGGDERHWIPLEDQMQDQSTAAHQPAGIQIGRGNKMIVRSCPASYDHPHVQLMQ
jgi:hypothetical protein